MVFVVGKAFIHLGAGDTGEASIHDGVHCLTVLEQSDYVVDTNAGAFDESMPAAYTHVPNDVAVARAGRSCRGFHAGILGNDR
jgi:hypothetical protein